MSRLDPVLEWITGYRARCEQAIAEAEANRADTAWTLRYVAALAETMEHAPLPDRRRIIAEIRDVTTPRLHNTPPGGADATT